jgi:Carboxylesterase family
MRFTFCTVLAVAVGLANASPPTATTDKGIYAGEHLPTFNQDRFIGIRYAQVPTGSLRFRPPKPLNESWSGQRTAVDYGNSCYAFGPYTDNAHLTQSEDCLTLNIVRPCGHKGKKLPVGVWIRKQLYTLEIRTEIKCNATQLTLNQLSQQTVEDLLKACHSETYIICLIRFSNLSKVVLQSLPFP